MTKVLLSHPPRPASHNSSRAMVWVRKNLFSSWSNSLLTIGCIWLMWELIPPLLNWAFLQANWVGTNVRAFCAFLTFQATNHSRGAEPGKTDLA